MENTSDSNGAGTAPEESPAVEAAQAQAAEPEPQVDEVELAQGRIAELEGEVAELKDKLLRALADGENLRRRADRELAEGRKFAVSAFARDILAVSDNLQRALEMAPDTVGEGDDALTRLLEGVKLTQRELANQFEKHGIRSIDPEGDKLDPNLHQAVLQIEHPDAAAGTVLQVMQVGYVIHDRLLRAAMVGVAKGPPPAPAEAADTAKSEAPADDAPEAASEDAAAAAAAEEVAEDVAEDVAPAEAPAHDAPADAATDTPDDTAAAGPAAADPGQTVDTKA